MYQGKFHVDDLTIGKDDSNVCVVAGWTPIPRVLKHLDKNGKYHAVVGPLYKPALGLSWLVRNLLLNPSIDHLVLIADTAEDKVANTASIANFFNEGVVTPVSEAGWLVKGTNYFLHAELPLGALNQLRSRITFVQTTLVEVGALVRSLYKPINTLIAPQDYPVPVVKQFSFTSPALPTGHTITGLTIADAWCQLVTRVYSNGVTRQYKQGVEWKELLNTSVTILQPSSIVDPHPLLPFDDTFVQTYRSSFTGEVLNKDSAYTYGVRIREHFGRDQLQTVVDKLKKNLDSTHCVCTVYDGFIDHESATPPCLTQLWYRVQDNKLSLTATFRSHEVYSAWAANCYGLASLQELVLNELKLFNRDIIKGSISVISFSAHIYDWAYENAAELAYHTLNNTMTNYSDPVGNFLITLNNGVVCIEQEQGGIIYNSFTQPLGNGIKTAKINARRMLEKLINVNPSISPQHSAYLGSELERVVNNHMQRKPFTQDAND